MSASRKVEMSKLPFRQLAEAEIGILMGYGFPADSAAASISPDCAVRPSES
jgi:hypothetical protein